MGCCVEEGDFEVLRLEVNFLWRSITLSNIRQNFLRPKRSFFRSRLGRILRLSWDFLRSSIFFLRLKFSFFEAVVQFWSRWGFFDWYHFKNRNLLFSIVDSFWRVWGCKWVSVCGECFLFFLDHDPTFLFSGAHFNLTLQRLRFFLELFSKKAPIKKASPRSKTLKNLHLDHHSPLNSIVIRDMTFPSL